MQRSAVSSKAGSNGTGEQPSGNVFNAASSHCLGHFVKLWAQLVAKKNTNLLESGTGRWPAQGLFNDVIMPNNSKRSRSFWRAGWRP